MILTAWMLSLKSLPAWLARRRAQRIARDAFMQLVWHDDKILRDVGLEREDVHWACSLPLHVDAARALRERQQISAPPKPIQRPPSCALGRLAPETIPARCRTLGCHEPVG